MTPPATRLRLSVLAVVVASLFAALGARLWFLQVVDTGRLATEARANQVRYVYEPAPRGRIKDRSGAVLVDNREALAVTLGRDDARASPETLERLGALLGRPAEELRRRTSDPRYSRYRPVPVAEDVTEDVALHLAEHAEEYPGVRVERLSRRAYPHGTLAAHLVGYVGETTPDDLAAQAPSGPDDAYRLGDTIGRTGVERAFEDALRGRPGRTALEVDSRGRVLGVLEERPPVPGHDVVLTLDLGAQQVAEAALAEGLAAARATRDRNTEDATFAAPAGSVVALDPRDGSVLAVASWPTYDPAEFVDGIDPERYRQLQDPAGRFPLLNRAVQSAYAPGSTFKLVTSAAALEAGLIDPATKKVDRGSLRVGNRSFRNAGGAAYGAVDVRRALTVSSDVFYYELGRDFWLQRDRFGEAPIQDAARRYGFGSPTGVPLDEVRGRVPDAALRQELHERFPERFPDPKWYAGDNVTLAIGQGELTATPLQLANAYATFANGGTRYRPRIGAAVVDREGRVVRTVAPEATGRAEMAPEARAAVLDGLLGVTTGRGGTARGAFAGFPAEFPVAAKTGTAQVQDRQDTALFAAFAPANDPRVAVAVVLEESGFGGTAAAPVARRLLEAVAGQPPTPAPAPPPAPPAAGAEGG